MRYINYFILATLFTSTYACTGTQSSDTQRASDKDSSMIPSTASTDTSEPLEHREDTFIDTQYFKATGNEPFWHLQLLGKSYLQFSSITEKEHQISLPIHVENIIKEDATSIIYKFDLDSQILNIQLWKEPCEDNMSGFLFPYTAEVQFDYPKSKETYTGCGDFMGDYRLHDIWALESIQQDTVVSNEDRPWIEFNLSGSTVAGSGGCNTFSGYVELSENQIKFNDLAVTLMACPDMDLEAKFFPLLTEKTYEFSIHDNRLFLSSADNELVFRKID